MHEIDIEDMIDEMHKEIIKIGNSYFHVYIFNSETGKFIKTTYEYWVERLYKKS